MWPHSTSQATSWSDVKILTMASAHQWHLCLGLVLRYFVSVISVLHSIRNTSCQRRSELIVQVASVPIGLAVIMLMQHSNCPMGSMLLFVTNGYSLSKGVSAWYLN
ncbi:hypothetical protein BOTBODRAFT_402099 [Botryobasidium botryosum FD-172 SS1]|uniref:Uncharacterized protein n=1 Tax=Botryobasidium botryosum (strain FD-172 SS1) TaxID=930990 RepID=A0A067MBC1_BOTB1|nr:hypothetical protein BOTBODRAFT_402099 [Botryobasidium botryosum FD-172 SS1]